MGAAWVVMAGRTYSCSDGQGGWDRLTARDLPLGTRAPLLFSQEFRESR